VSFFKYYKIRTRELLLIYPLLSSKYKRKGKRNTIRHGALRIMETAVQFCHHSVRKLYIYIHTHTREQKDGDVMSK
jgi:hypothetical protein